MKLEIGDFQVNDVRFGKQTSFDNGVLTINKEEALNLVYEDDRIISADIQIAKPGDESRIVPVKEAVEPRCKVSEGVMFPGVTNKLTQVGMGRTHALKGTSVLAVGQHWGGFQDGLIDMSGSGAKQTMFSETINICLVADTNEDHEKHERQKKNTALRWASMKLAEYLGSCVEDLEPDELNVWNHAPLDIREEEVNKLPGIVYILQLQSQMLEEGYNAMVYGWDASHLLSTYMTPNEVLDGAVVSGSFMPSSSKISTYQHVNNEVIKRLMNEHGKTINFLGVILSNLNVVLAEKQRSAFFVRQLAAGLGAEGAVISEEGYGNPDSDFIMVYNQLEDANIKVVGITNESSGRDGRSQPLVDLSDKADAIVSTGNVSQFLNLEALPNIIGELGSLERDGMSGSWKGSIKEDGSIEIENNLIFCADSSSGNHYKTVVEY